MRTKTKLTLEQTQQGVSDEVLAETGSIHMLSETPKLLSGIEDSYHGPSDAMHNPSQPLKVIPMVAAAGLRQVKIYSHMLILDRHTEEVLKLNNFKKYDNTSFQDKEKYEHVGSKVTRSQEGKRLQDDEKRLCLVDDLKKLKITYKSS
ncbi:hypothetical protein Tco_1335779 [Tanacetum coccineum]